MRVKDAQIRNFPCPSLYSLKLGSFWLLKGLDFIVSNHADGIFQVRISEKNIRKLRKKIASNRVLKQCVAYLVSWYIRFCYISTRWQRIGFDEMDDCLRNKQPIMALVWHERIWMSPYMFNTKLGKICSVTTKSEVADVGHLLLERFDFEAEMIDPKKSPLAVNRRLLQRIRNGYSIAVSPDGTRGPSRVAKPFPITWVRQTNIPVFCVTFSMRRSLRLPTWDRSLVPLPFNRGVLLARRWTRDVPKRMSNEQFAALTNDVGNQLNALTDEADNMLGVKKASSKSNSMGSPLA